MVNSLSKSLKFNQSVAGFDSTVKKIHYYMVHFDWEEESVLNIVYRGLCFCNSLVKQALIIYSTSKGITKIMLFLVQRGLWKSIGY